MFALDGGGASVLLSLLIGILLTQVHNRLSHIKSFLHKTTSIQLQRQVFRFHFPIPGQNVGCLAQMH